MSKSDNLLTKKFVKFFLNIFDSFFKIFPFFYTQFSWRFAIYCKNIGFKLKIIVKRKKQFYNKRMQ